ncbi:MAG: glycosyltransferase family 4 protein, partial [Synechococcaceae cyanobacterium]|nr:glycosyltransferase family 4 protein [Synechococcaceae cyanobacterium]
AIPLVIISDSRAAGPPRARAAESAKRLLLRGYSAALVAGSESRAYLESLGFPPGAIHQPWDVIDAAPFRRGAERARRRCRRLGWQPPPHFLCVARFVPEKNHAGLLEAYGAYQRQGGHWGLRLIGGGPLQGELRRRRATLPDPDRLRIDDFRQQARLAVSYGMAGALVLPSRRDTWGLVVNEAIAAELPVLVSRACGCAVDLIAPEAGGWIFDPGDTAALTSLLHRMEALASPHRQGKVARCRERLGAFTLEAFAAGLVGAVEQARSQPRSSRRAVAVAELLSRRPRP